MKRIRVAVPNPDDCMHCERALDDAAIPFDLIPHPESAVVVNGFVTFYQIGRHFNLG